MGAQTLEGVSVRLLLLLFLSLSACSFFKTKENVADLDKIKEFDQAVKINEIPELEKPSVVQEAPPKKAKKKTVTKPKEANKKAIETPTIVTKREPDIEDADGFVGRRPVNDPYRIGENVTMAVKYFGVVAGDLSLEVGKMVEVNGKKSYSFTTTVKSNPSFAIFYEVNDVIKTFVDYESLVPVGYSLRIRETNDVKEGRNIFDWSSMKSLTWTKYVEGSNVKEEKEEHDLLAYSQNVYSAAFYLRNFNLKEGKELVFRVHDKGKTLLFKGQVLRKEVLETSLGPKNTVVIKPQFEMDGIFKPVGDIYFWLTDDDRKFLIKVECKIKIGRLVGELKSIDMGQSVP